MSNRSVLLSVILALVLILTLRRSNVHWESPAPPRPPPFHGATIINSETLNSVTQHDIYSGEPGQDPTLEAEPLRVYIPPAIIPPDDSTWSVEPTQKEPSCPPPPPPPPPEEKEKKERALITYAYSETEFARANLKFFVEHGLHDAADFIFILNGETDVGETIIPKKGNIQVVQRDNTCFDLGAHAKLLTAKEPEKEALKDVYKRFILMNASTRGPFMPVWSKECWTDAYLNKLTDKVKLVGSTLNCLNDPSRAYVQSTIWATDNFGLSYILTPSGIDECFPTLESATEGEMRTTPYLRSLGFEIDVMMTSYSSEPNHAYIEKQCAGQNDALSPGSYFGSNVQPFELIFMKTQMGVDDVLLERLTEWAGGMGYSSYDVCK